MSDPAEVDQVDDENITQPDPSNGTAPNGVPNPPQAPGIGEVIKY